MAEGILYVVGTPIGNLDDMTLRARRILQEVDLIAAEDTRHTRKLLSHFDIHTPMTSYFEHNKKEKGGYLISLLQQGKSVALVSDAGMPGISDPGEDVVKEAVRAGLKVVPIPGPSASLAALVVSGLPTARFVFEGFLPRDKKERKERLSLLCGELRTTILYESPYRLIETLEELLEYVGDRPAAVAREITKHYEEIIRGPLGDLILYFKEHPPKGEIALVLAGAQEAQAEFPGLGQIKEEINRLVAAGMMKKEAVKEVARRYGMPKSEVYKISLES
ncbi:16S rRNA (cytidine(1402)-2'-O)-methyltransferase [Candidatus Formimonas warabiya]|uniref:Ribosomal RNA small subunit methyltransferase I n=1 Tax=Formimonas warabiya TaxID=1761012 RepID=A0A3G1KVH9_FORW1|nr:16S rRNA (cytidine(1402)-2'-O)-methyltransferase [Candidatus Formimonas warabiya]ATW26464.1 16S rRNA (cytidine(1402)-2'-O)-methyltransferase [Candidatus Formimonas warabiya]